MFDVLVFNKEKKKMETRLSHDMVLDELRIFFYDKYPSMFNSFETFLNQKQSMINKDEWDLLYLFFE
jgi:hypothetical protein